MRNRPFVHFNECWMLLVAYERHVHGDLNPGKRMIEVEYDGIHPLLTHVGLAEAAVQSEPNRPADLEVDGRDGVLSFNLDNPVRIEFSIRTIRRKVDSSRLTDLHARNRLLQSGKNVAGVGVEAKW